MTRPSLLIENWLPIAEIGAESMRERGASSALPPLYFLHVWWARRPLTASRAAILAGVLPQWSADWPEPLHRKFPDEQTYHRWFLHLIGVKGNPVQGMKLIRMAKAKGIQLNFHPYGGAPRAFTVNPDAETLDILFDLLEFTWGTHDLSVLDPFAGGGSIPFEALRYGFTTYANDLNPVAATILKATLDYPARFGLGLAEDIKKWGNLWAQRVKKRLDPYFPKGKGENIFAYLWARTITWKGRTIPLSPNWWLSTGDKPAAVRLIADPDAVEPRFEILCGDALRAAQLNGYDPEDGTIVRGVARCPWTGETIDGEYIKAEAQAGRMGQVLYSVAIKKSGSIDFRCPTPNDLDSILKVEKALFEKRNDWISNDIIPTEELSAISNYDRGHRLYGMYHWESFFAPRQKFTLSTMLETMKDIEKELRIAFDTERANAILTYLSFMLDKATIYNCITSRWHSGRSVMAPQFERHNFAFRWSFAEFDGADNLVPWAVEQITDAYSGISSLISPSQKSILGDKKQNPLENLSLSKGSAASQKHLANATIENITLDPPYYDNVQYAELSDFFYVWLKRSVGPLFPEFFTDELTNKDDEAVANPARFAALGSKKKVLAEQDYERKMAAAFREMHRVLRDDGVLTVMFTHKKVEAWDTLASALIGAGFTIQASWPIHTESEYSLHQAKKNAAASTILLVCRKRETVNSSQEPVWWNDIQGEVRRVAREKAAEYADQGITGADLYISVFGPTLSVISQCWPVLTSEIDTKTGHPKPLRPEIALDLAREEVVRLRKQGLLAGRDIQFDAITDWYLMAWDAYQAEQFPYDEARKLAIALGVDLDHDLMSIKHLAAKKGEYVTLLTPVQRRKNGMVDDEVTAFDHWVDATHTAMMIYSEDGAGACDVFLQKSGLKRDQTFKALLQAMLNAIPRSRVRGKFIRPEAEALENMRLAFFDDLTVPQEEELEIPAVQLSLLQGHEEELGEVEEGDGEDE